MTGFDVIVAISVGVIVARILRARGQRAAGRPPLRKRNEAAPETEADEAGDQPDDDEVEDESDDEEADEAEPDRAEPEGRGRSVEEGAHTRWQAPTRHPPADLGPDLEPGQERPRPPFSAQPPHPPMRALPPGAPLEAQSAMDPLPPLKPLSPGHRGE